MALRLLEVFLTGSGGELIEDALKDLPIIDMWQNEFQDSHTAVSLLVSAEDSEEVMDRLDTVFGPGGGIRVVLIPVETTSPLPEKAQPEKTSDATKPKAKASRISRQELYSDIGQTIDGFGIFITFVVLSTIVAVVGLLKDSVAIIIGAMVIAPLLGPNVAMALAVALGDTDLAKRSANINVVGVLLALGISVVTGMILTVDPNVPEILNRTQISYGDILLALASGTAGTLAFTTGASSSLIGVMVAVALLPPLVTAGLLLGSGHYSLALGAFLLLATNIICVNLAGVLTFFVQKVRPNTWWEADKAKRTSRIAITIWTVLLLALFTILFTSKTV